MPAISLFTLEDDDEEETLFPVVEVSLDGTLENPSSYSAVDLSKFCSFLSVLKMRIIVLFRLCSLPFYTNKEKRRAGLNPLSSCSLFFSSLSLRLSNILIPVSV